MKKSKVLTGTLAFALMGMVITPIDTFAASGSGSGITDVSYNNDGTIPDPENPTDPEWTVKIPTAIVFTNTKKTADANVEINATAGNTLPTTGEINVTVKSQNNYVLTATGTTPDPMAYSLVYGGNTMSQTMTTVGDLVQTNTILGEAKLNPSAVAKVSGSHTDLLTYTVTVTQP